MRLCAQTLRQIMVYVHVRHNIRKEINTGPEIFKADISPGRQTSSFEARCYTSNGKELREK